MIIVRSRLGPLLSTEFMHATKVTELDTVHILSLHAFLFLHYNFLEGVKLLVTPGNPQVQEPH
jgi:hypothetical protein